MDPESLVPVPSPQTPLRSERPADRYWRATYLFVGAITLAGVGVRYTIQDRWLFFSTVFYATPLPLLCVGALISALCTGQLGWRKQSLSWLFTTGLLLSMWHWHDWQRHPVPAKGDDITVLFWNVARRPDMAPAAARIREIDADVVALVEAGGAHAERRKFWKEQLPDYDLSTLGGGLLLFIKGTSGKSTPGELDRGSLWRLIPCETKGAQFNCMVVDLKSDPYYSRRKVFQQLLDLTQQLDGEPLLMVGDFNTPIDSLHYRSMREHLREAFEVAGHGYAPTWPYPAPVLTLDQVWVNRHVEVVHCRRLTPVNSDHLPVLTTFRIVPQ